MMKQWAVALSVTISSGMTMATEVSRINEKWGETGTSYSMTQESYNEELVSKMHDIILNFHMVDTAGTEAALPFHNNDSAEYKVYADDQIQKSADRLKNRKGCLLSISKNEELVGGTYFSVEQDGEVVRMQHAGFRLDLPMEEIGFSQQKMMEVLSSRTYFPDIKTLVVYLRHNSALEPRLFMLGFDKGTYKSVDNPEDQYQPYEKVIVG